MNAIYTGVLRALCQDDINGAAALYPAPVGGLAAAPDVVTPNARSGRVSLVALVAAAALAMGLAVASLAIRRRAQ